MQTYVPYHYNLDVMYADFCSSENTNLFKNLRK